MKLLVCSTVAVASVLLAGCGGSGGGGFTPGPTVAITTPAAIPSGSTGQPMTFAIQAAFPNPPGAYYLTGGALPTGMQLDSFTGVVTGFPRQVGHFSFEVAAQDGVEGKYPPGRDASFAEDRRTFQVDILRGPVQILPQIPPTAQYRASYGYQIDVAGGTPPYTFEQTGGTLPAGLTVSATGQIGNFPTRADEHPYHVNVTVTDSLGGQHTRQLDIDVVVLPLFIKTSNLPEASEGFPYTAELELSSPGGGAPYNWIQLPPAPDETLLSAMNMQLEAATGKISTLTP